jgi:hypothetical protein
VSALRWARKKPTQLTTAAIPRPRTHDGPDAPRRQTTTENGALLLLVV